MSKALINPTPPQGEEDRANKVFSMFEEHVGFVPDGLRLYGISPPLLETFATNVGYFGEGTPLSPVLTTLIRYLVSDRAECRFCIDLNESFLVGMDQDLDTVRASRDDIRKAPVSDRERVLLELALRSVEEPESIGAADIEHARGAGWHDREIFDAVAQATANRAFNFLLKTFNIEEQGAFA